jgi:hypothetical protein
MITLPTDTRKYTTATELFVVALNQAFPDAGTLGIYNRRKIANSTSWSQHSWGNAVDIKSPARMALPPNVSSSQYDPRYAEHFAYMDRVNAWIMRNAYLYHVRYRAWRRSDHYNHIHVDFNPKQYGTPPLLSSIQGDDDVAFAEYLKGVQESLNEAGFRDGRGRLLTVDGKFGANTLAAIKKRDVAAALAPPAPEIVLDVDTVRVVKGVRLA